MQDRQTGNADGGRPFRRTVARAVEQMNTSHDTADAMHFVSSRGEGWGSERHSEYLQIVLSDESSSTGSERVVYNMARKVSEPADPGVSARPCGTSTSQAAKLWRGRTRPESSQGALKPEAAHPRIACYTMPLHVAHSRRPESEHPSGPDRSEAGCPSATAS